MSEAATTFQLLQATDIPSLNLRYEEYQHSHTQARHIHLASDNPENVFLVALRTVPTDSTGVAHILEHTTLCGSEKFPVRDPFFMMIRRSLNTFMNAFTSSDWTAYPFASQNRKDFDNLLQVYLDAVFFARLDPLDFSQEGHRIEFEEAGNPDSNLAYKGVVFNEMKGAMSSISSQLWQAVGEELFPDTTYGFNSGGDPEAITDLSYEQLIAFYKTHYHPDNALFITYGDIPANEHQQKFEQLALSRFEQAGNLITVPQQQSFAQPKRATKYYPVDSSDEKENKTHLVMAWKLDSITDPLEVLTLHLMSSALLENSASPLQKALETTELGSSPSPLCGLDDGSLEMVFVCGLEGSRHDRVDDFEELVLSTIKQVAEQGIEQQTLVALLDQLELQQREISGDSYPYGLQLMLSCLATAIHRGDPAAALDVDPILGTLRQRIQDPAFIRDLVQEKLLDNPHRVTVVMRPDPELAGKRVEKENAQLASIRSQLDDEQRQKIIDTATALQQRQMQEDDPELLPKVTLEDIPEDIPVPESRTETLAAGTLTYYPQGTNGLVYQQVLAEMPTLDEELLEVVSLHNRMLTELGVGQRDYLETQQWQSQVCGSISSYSSMRGRIDNEQDITAYFTLSSKGLASHCQDIAELMQKTWSSVRFDELPRIRELIAQFRARAENSITGNGHSLAMAIASQNLSPTAKLSHGSSGVLGIQRLKALDDSLQDEKNLAALADKLSRVQQKIVGKSPQFLNIGEESQQDTLQQAVSSRWQAGDQHDESVIQLPSSRGPARELWLCNTQVNFCAKAYPTVTSAHADAPALTVLGGVLRNGFLHTAIRETGGAYGGGASQDSSIGAFRFYSYRDPRLVDTLDDFDRSISWLLDNDHEWRVVEEAILGVIGSIDKPASPAGTAKQHFHNLLYGRTPEQQKAFRQGVLEVRLADLKRVAETYLQPANASIGIISHSGEAGNYQPLCDKENIALCQL